MILKLKFLNCFKPEMQNHIVKNIKLGDKFVTNFKYKPNTTVKYKG